MTMNNWPYEELYIDKEFIPSFHAPAPGPAGGRPPQAQANGSGNPRPERPGRPQAMNRQSPRRDNSKGNIIDIFNTHNKYQFVSITRNVILIDVNVL